ncbi:MAG: putative AAA+ superfamily ATPase, partial [Rickettsiales bacterium]
MLVNRTISGEIIRRLEEKESKIIVIYGARQVGKTTLVNKILKEKFNDKRILSVEGDSYQFSDILSSRDLGKLSNLVKGYDILFIDEAQKIENIGINLKILYDKFKDNLKIIVTGSSSLELANKIKEPLTGRHHTYHLYPISLLELSKTQTNYELSSQTEERMIFGAYPEIFRIENMQDKIAYLNNLSTDYLYKDVLELENIRFNKKLRDLVRLLAFQIGSEVSYNELATTLGMDRKTVDSYIDLLEKAFVLVRIYGFSRNLRKEVNKKPKIYFYDLGIRNAIIGNFNYLNARNDVGALWENFLMLERIKRNSYQRHYCNQYFWRTYTGAELDYVEEYAGELHGYEFKYSKISKAPKSWIETYKQENARFECVN